MSIVIVGASLAGATTAAALREFGVDDEVILLGAEDCLPYERPELSKGYLAGEVPAGLLLVHPREFYDDARIDVYRGEHAVGLDPDRKLLRLQTGEALHYTRLVIATGAENIRPPIPGIDRPWVHQLRTLDDADRLRAHIPHARTAVVVGMGFIGCEVAATLRGMGLEVTAVDASPGPQWDLFGAEVSGMVRGWHEEHGVRVLTGQVVAAISDDNTVELDSGLQLPADLVVVGVGVRPSTGWLDAVPLHLVRGAIGVDSSGRTNLPDIYAAGDVCATWDPVRQRHRHHGHWSAAIDQARRVARQLAGLEPIPAEVPYFWSSQYNQLLQYVGTREPDAQIIRRPDRTTFLLRRRGPHRDAHRQQRPRSAPVHDTARSGRRPRRPHQPRPGSPAPAPHLMSSR